MPINSRAPVAQLDRVLDYESRGYRFDSCRAHHRSLTQSSSYEHALNFLCFCDSVYLTFVYSVGLKWVGVGSKIQQFTPHFSYCVKAPTTVESKKSTNRR